MKGQGERFAQSEKANSFTSCGVPAAVVLVLEIAAHVELHQNTK